MGLNWKLQLSKKQEGKSKKVEVVKTLRFNFEDNPEVKNSISFK